MRAQLESSKRSKFMETMSVYRKAMQPLQLGRPTLNNMMFSFTQKRF